MVFDSAPLQIKTSHNVYSGMARRVFDLSLAYCVALCVRYLIAYIFWKRRLFVESVEEFPETTPSNILRLKEASPERRCGGGDAPLDACQDYWRASIQYNTHLQGPGDTSAIPAVWGDLFRTIRKYERFANR
jgi:hypothetical protein